MVCNNDATDLGYQGIHTGSPLAIGWKISSGNSQIGQTISSLEFNLARYNSGQPTPTGDFKAYISDGSGIGTLIGEVAGSNVTSVVMDFDTCTFTGSGSKVLAEDDICYVTTSSLTNSAIIACKTTNTAGFAIPNTTSLVGANPPTTATGIIVGCIGGSSPSPSSATLLPPPIAMVRL